jgi:hypothetical protein
MRYMDDRDCRCKRARDDRHTNGSLYRDAPSDWFSRQSWVKAVLCQTVLFTSLELPTGYDSTSLMNGLVVQTVSLIQMIETLLNYLLKLYLICFLKRDTKTVTSCFFSITQSGCSYFLRESRLYKPYFFKQY